MIDMKKLGFLIIVFVLLFGCTNIEPKVNGNGELNKTEYNGSGVESVVIPTINNEFELMEYDLTEFDIQSTGFIKLDKNNLSNFEEGETLYLTPYIQNDTGTMFNSIFVKEISCGAKEVKIFDDTYKVSDLEGNFNNDDRWQIEVKDCNVIIKMDGYFYGLKEGESAPLFTYKNNVLVQFIDLDNEPKMRVIISKAPPQEKH